MRISTGAKLCSKQKTLNAAFWILLAAMLFPGFSQADEASDSGWKVDFSRRAKDLSVREPASEPVKESVLDNVFSPNADPTQEMVILNTDKGFIPSVIRVRAGQSYKIHVVNINEQEKNVSFVLDSFSEHHATYYGKRKDFVITPKQEGVFTYQSPETSAQGRLVVAPADAVPQPQPERELSPEVRTPASINPQE